MFFLYSLHKPRQFAFPFAVVDFGGGAGGRHFLALKIEPFEEPGLEVSLPTPASQAVRAPTSSDLWPFDTHFRFWFLSFLALSLVSLVCI